MHPDITRMSRSQIAIIIYTVNDIVKSDLCESELSTENPCIAFHQLALMFKVISKSHLRVV